MFTWPLQVFNRPVPERIHGLLIISNCPEQKISKSREWPKRTVSNKTYTLQEGVEKLGIACRNPELVNYRVPEAAIHTPPLNV